MRARRGGTGSKYVTLRGGVRRAIPFLLVRSGGCARSSILCGQNGKTVLPARVLPGGQGGLPPPFGSTSNGKKESATWGDITLSGLRAQRGSVEGHTSAGSRKLRPLFPRPASMRQCWWRMAPKTRSCRKPRSDALSTLPPEPQHRRRLAWYEDGYHLLLRDLQGPVAAADVATWALAPRAPLPSGVDREAEEAFAHSASQASVDGR